MKNLNELYTERLHNYYEYFRLLREFERKIPKTEKNRKYRDAFSEAIAQLKNNDGQSPAKTKKIRSAHEYICALILDEMKDLPIESVDNNTIYKNFKAEKEIALPAMKEISRQTRKIIEHSTYDFVILDVVSNLIKKEKELSDNYKKTDALMQSNLFDVEKTECELLSKLDKIIVSKQNGKSTTKQRDRG